MSGFLYWFPGHDPITVPRLRATGVDVPCRDLLDRWTPGVTHQEWAVDTAPDGTTAAGTLLYPFPDDGELPSVVGRVDREGVRWFQCGDVWLGFEIANPPVPETLLRPSTVSGADIVLGDGAVWLAPLVRSPLPVDNPTPHLPKRFGLGDDGQFAQRTAPCWEWLWEVSGRVWDHLHSAESIPWSEAAILASSLLSANYRVGQREVLALELLGDETIVRLFRIACNEELIGELERLLADDPGVPPANPPMPPSPTSHGDEAAIPDTAPAEPTCSSPPAVAANRCETTV